MGRPSPVSVKCPTCDVSFPLPSQVLHERGDHVWLRLDRSSLYGHLTACAGAAGERAGERAALVAAGPAKAELAGRVDRFLDTGAYVAEGGSRACTMCGVNGSACLERVRATRKGCCGLCEAGNTHPAPQADLACAEWAVVHAPKR